MSVKIRYFIRDLDNNKRWYRPNRDFAIEVAAMWVDEDNGYCETCFDSIEEAEAEIEEIFNAAGTYWLYGDRLEIVKEYKKWGT